MEEPFITWYPSRLLLISSGTSSVKRLFCGGKTGAAGVGAFGGAAADEGKGTGGRVCRDGRIYRKCYCLVCCTHVVLMALYYLWHRARSRSMARRWREGVSGSEGGGEGVLKRHTCGDCGMYRRWDGVR